MGPGVRLPCAGQELRGSHPATRIKPAQAAPRTSALHHTNTRQELPMSTTSATTDTSTSCSLCSLKNSTEYIKSETYFWTEKAREIPIILKRFFSRGVFIFKYSKSFTNCNYTPTKKDSNPTGWVRISYPNAASCGKREQAIPKNPVI